LDGIINIDAESWVSAQLGGLTYLMLTRGAERISGKESLSNRLFGQEKIQPVRKRRGITKPWCKQREGQQILHWSHEIGAKAQGPLYGKRNGLRRPAPTTGFGRPMGCEVLTRESQERL